MISRLCISVQFLQIASLAWQREGRRKGKEEREAHARLVKWGEEGEEDAEEERVRRGEGRALEKTNTLGGGRTEEEEERGANNPDEAAAAAPEMKCVGGYIHEGKGKALCGGARRSSSYLISHAHLAPPLPCTHYHTGLDGSQE